MFSDNRSTYDQIQNFLGKGDYNAACKRQKAVAALAGVMALKGHTDLHHTPAQNDQADGTDQAEDEAAQVIDHLDGVTGGKGRNGEAELSATHSTVQA